MTRGQHRCIVSAQNKGTDEETIYISPDQLDKTYAENGIATNCVITLYEFRGNILNEDEDAGEEGEDEMEEMEEELEELENPDEANNEGEEAV